MTLADNQADVVVVGGGLAGISAAIELAEAGLRVMLLEARPWLGGATWSFARRGVTIDNGQHAFIRGCEAYRDLLTKLGVLTSVAIQDRLDLTVLGTFGTCPACAVSTAQVGPPGAAAPRERASRLPPAHRRAAGQSRRRGTGIAVHCRARADRPASESRRLASATRAGRERPADVLGSAVSRRTRPRIW